MGVRLNRLIGTIACTTVLTSLSSAAFAQETPRQPARPTVPPTPLEVLDDAFFRNSGNFYENDDIIRELGVLFGPFPENNITRDAAAVNRVYNSLLVQQSQLDPTIRTADLENPFTASLLTMPEAIRAQEPGRTVDFVPPPVPTLPQAPVAPTAPAAPDAPRGPVRALF